MSFSPKLHVAACLWDANEKTEPNSRCFTDEWAEKLYRGVRRNLTVPFEFVLFTDRARSISAGIKQWRLSKDVPDFGCLIEPFKIQSPLMVMGLDTIIVKNIDHLAKYCMEGKKIALPRDPYSPERSINAIALVPRRNDVFRRWRGENDMEWLRTFPWSATDDLFPGQILSLKYHKIRDAGVPDEARVVYFHGRPKPHELTHLPWVQEHWR